MCAAQGLVSRRTYTVYTVYISSLMFIHLTKRENVATRSLASFEGSYLMMTLGMLSHLGFL